MVWNAIIRDVKGLSPQMLDSFVAGKDLSVEVLKDLTKVMLNGHAVYDEASGMLKTAYDAPPIPMGYPPDAFVHHDPKVAKMQAACREALKAAESSRTTGIKLEPAAPTTTKREGWLGEFFPTPVKVSEPVRRERFIRKREA